MQKVGFNMKMRKWEESFSLPGYWIKKKHAERIHMRQLRLNTPKAYYKWKKQNKFNKVIWFIPNPIVEF